MKKLTAESLREYLASEEFDCFVQEAGDKNPFPAVVLHLGEDYQQRGQLLYLILKHQLFNPEGEKQSPNDPKSTHFVLEYRTILPFPVQDKGVADTARFLCFINKSIDLPGFELDEVERVIFYRHAFMGKNDKVDAPSLMALIGNTMMLLDLFSPHIEQIASGKITMNELVDKALEELKGI